MTMGRARRKWTPEEDSLLRDAVQAAMDESRSLLWRELAKSVPGRSNKDCRRRWWNSLAEGTFKGLWSEEEDECLMLAVREHGTNWRLVAQEVGTRTPDQCSSHWTQVLDPEINHCDWSPEEDDELLHEVLTYSTNWKTISTIHVPNRTTLSLKNRYSTLRLKFQKKNAQEKASASARQLKSSELSHSVSPSKSTSDRRCSDDSSSIISDRHSHSHSIALSQAMLAHTHSPVRAMHMQGNDSDATSGKPYPALSIPSPMESVIHTGSMGFNHESSELYTPLQVSSTSLHSDMWPNEPSMVNSHAKPLSLLELHEASAYSHKAGSYPVDYNAALFGQKACGGNDFDFLTSFTPQEFSAMDNLWV